MGETECVEEYVAYESIITLANQMYDATCRVTDIKRILGGKVVSIEVKALTINEMPASLFSRETILEAESQMRHDWRVLGDIQCQAVEEEPEPEGDYTGGDAMDRAYERMEGKERRTA
jgi:hypothetical protein